MYVNQFYKYKMQCIVIKKKLEKIQLLAPHSLQEGMVYPGSLASVAGKPTVSSF